MTEEELAAGLADALLEINSIRRTIDAGCYIRSIATSEDMHSMLDSIEAGLLDLWRTHHPSPSAESRRAVIVAISNWRALGLCGP